MIKTLSQALKMDKERFQVPKSVQAGGSDPQDLAGWHLPGRK